MADLTEEKNTLTALHELERRIEPQFAELSQRLTATAVATSQRLDSHELAERALTGRLAAIERTLARLEATEKQNTGFDTRLKDLGRRLAEHLVENRQQRTALTTRLEALAGAYEWGKHRLSTEQAGDKARLDDLTADLSSLRAELAAYTAQLDHSLQQTQTLAFRALVRPGTLTHDLTVPAHLQDAQIGIAAQPNAVRQFQPAQFVRVGTAVGQLRNPATSEHGDEVWTLKLFTKQSAGATLPTGTPVELIGNRADATPHFD